MEFKIRKRVLEESEIFLSDRTTVRDVAKKMNISKSTVHKDFVERLPLINKEKYIEVSKLLEYNKNIRHLRGGEATKKLFLNKKQNLGFNNRQHKNELILVHIWKSDLKRKNKRF